MKWSRKAILLTVAAAMLMPAVGHAQNLANDLQELGSSLKELGEATKELFGLFKKKNKGASFEAETVGVDAYAEQIQGGFRVVTGHPDFKIKVVRCEAAGRTCVIDLILENVGSKDMSLTICGGGGLGPGFDVYHTACTVAYDDEANDYRDDQINVSVGRSEMQNGTVNAELLSEVPIKARIQITGVPEAATMFRRIDMNVICRGWNLDDSNKVKFYNLPISREGDE